MLPKKSSSALPSTLLLLLPCALFSAGLPDAKTAAGLANGFCVPAEDFKAADGFAGDWPVAAVAPDALCLDAASTGRDDAFESPLFTADWLDFWLVNGVTNVRAGNAEGCVFAGCPVRACGGTNSFGKGGGVKVGGTRSGGLASPPDGDDFAPLLLPFPDDGWRVSGLMKGGLAPWVNGEVDAV